MYVRAFLMPCLAPTLCSSFHTTVLVFQVLRGPDRRGDARLLRRPLRRGRQARRGRRAQGPHAAGMQFTYDVRKNDGLVGPPFFPFSTLGPQLQLRDLC